jgi:hypothetical protein
MKKIIYTFLIFLGTFSFYSCEKSRPIVYTEKNFVHFQDTLINISESSVKEDANGTVENIPSMVTIRINRATSDISKDLVVGFSVKAKYVKEDSLTGNEVEVGDVPQGRYYLSSPSAITIKAGEAFAFITLTAVNNEDVDGDKKITLSLESTSDASFNLGYPGSSAKNKKLDLYIIDDDCPLKIDDFVGTLKVKEFSARAGDVREYTVVSTQTGPNTISIVPFFDPAGTDLASNGPNPVPVTLTLNASSKSVFIATQPAFQYTTGTLAGQFRHAVDGTVVGVKPSQLNTCGKVMRISYGIQNISSGGVLEIVELGEYKK